jgi:hypothetical protein
MPGFDTVFFCGDGRVILIDTVWCKHIVDKSMTLYYMLVVNIFLEIVDIFLNAVEEIIRHNKCQSDYI